MDSPITCRICFESSDEESLIAPCRCNGSSKFVHKHCLQKWVTASKKTVCECCRSHYIQELSIEIPSSEHDIEDIFDDSPPRIDVSSYILLVAALVFFVYFMWVNTVH